MAEKGTLSPMTAQSSPRIPGELPFAAFVARVEAALRDPLPGGSGHELMAPIPRPGWTRDLIPPGARLAGGLLLLFPLRDRPHVLLTVRSRDLPNHKGQVSLPGGTLEAGEIPRDAALREAHEEAGIDPAHVRVLGELSPLYIPVSGFTLHPFVGAATERPAFRAEPGEVDRLLEVPLDRLRDPACLGRDERELLGRTRRVRYFDVEGERVWGATAMVLAEFLCLIGSPPLRTTS